MGSAIDQVISIDRGENDVSQSPSFNCFRRVFRLMDIERRWRSTGLDTTKSTLKSKQSSSSIRELCRCRGSKSGKGEVRREYRYRPLTLLSLLLLTCRSHPNNLQYWDIAHSHKLPSIFAKPHSRLSTEEHADKSEEGVVVPVCKFNPLKSCFIFAKFPPAGIGRFNQSGKRLEPGILDTSPPCDKKSES